MLELQPGEGGSCGLALRRSPDGCEQTRVMYDAALQELILERSQSSQDDTVERHQHRAPLQLAAGEHLQLHIFLDRSVIEVFANQRVCITSRIYPTQADSLGLALLAEGADAQLAELQVWYVKSIW